ncbi:hypothetical protein BD626DRAFT_625931 [Schizophyllum amplum]|uniref:F-box domain-containing protein n=1 Tax=Schizophyllum amplum TaxID=97359 RepID=A0A550CRU4_9AGAR|nr:hypothetical protein BD626DRAFT_625931 [Auriculariopsis ampla]
MVPRTMDQYAKMPDERLEVSYKPEHSYHGFRWGTVQRLSQPLLLLPELRADLEGSLKIAKLDEHVASISAQLTAIISYRNLFAPVSRLPDELVAEIFRHYAHASICFPCLAWTKLMSVCRRWHDIGISTPFLWSDIHINPSRFGRLKLPVKQLRLSGAHPLTVSLDLPHQGQLVVLLSRKGLGQHLCRIKSLEVEASPYAIEELLLPITRTKGNILRSLSLSAAADNHIDDDVTVLSSETTQIVMQHIQVLKLDKVEVDWTFLHALTSLTVHASIPSEWSWQTPDMHLNVSALIALLRRSRALEYLSLRSCITADDAEQAMDIVSHHQLQNRSKLPLPPLKRIHWADDFPYDNRRSMCKLLIQVLDAFMQAGAQLDDVTLDGFTTYQISMEVLKSLAECVTNKRVIMDGQVKELYEIEFALLEWCETEEESLYEGTDSDGW